MRERDDALLSLCRISLKLLRFLCLSVTVERQRGGTPLHADNVMTFLHRATYKVVTFTLIVCGLEVPTKELEVRVLLASRQQ